MKNIQASDLENLFYLNESEVEVSNIKTLEQVERIKKLISQGVKITINEFSISSLEILVELTKIDGIKFKEKLVIPVSPNDKFDELIEVAYKLDSISIEICIEANPYIPVEIIEKIKNSKLTVRCNVPIISSKYIEEGGFENNNAISKYTFFRFTREEYLAIKYYVDEIKLLISEYEQYRGEPLTNKEILGLVFYFFADSTQNKPEDSLAHTTHPSKSWLTLINGKGVCSRICTCFWYAC